MSEWLDLEPDKKSAAAAAPVRFALSKAGRGGKAPARGVLLIRKDVIAQLGMTTWRCRIRIGRGGRAHQIALVPDPGGPFELHEVGVAKGGGTYRVRLPVVTAWPDAAVSAMERSFRIEPEGKVKLLVVDLPAFCWDANQRRQLQAREGRA